MEQTVKTSKLGRILVFFVTAAGLFWLTSEAAKAVTVDWTGTVANSCVITVGSNGVLGLSLDGKNLSSDQTVGAPAIVSVASTSNNIVTFNQPIMSLRAAGYLGNPAMHTRQSSNKGHINEWQQNTYQVGVESGDTVFNFHARAEDSNTFPMGIYRMSSEVTCAPPN